MKHLHLIAFLLLFLIPLSCDKENENPVPFVQVDFQINIESVQFIELNAPGGWAYFTGGYGGIIIYRLSDTEFKAYDRACPFHPFDTNALVRVFDPPLATDTLCGSMFEMTTNSIIQGPSKHPLREYRTFYTPPYLQVTNY